MIFPSLLFTSEPSEFLVSDEAYEDIKLSSMLSADVIEIMRHPCGEADIVARQNIFKLLDREGKTLFDYLTKLFEGISDTAELYKHFKNAECKNAANVIYINLIKKYIDFCLLACDISREVKLFSRFGEAFDSLCGSERFISAKSETDMLYPKLSAFEKNVCHVSGIIQQLTSAYEYKSNSTFSGEKKNAKTDAVTENTASYLSRLIKCAEELGLDGITPPKLAPKKLSSGIVDSLAEIYKDEFAAFDEFAKNFGDFFPESVIDYYVQLKLIIELNKLAATVRENGMPTCYPVVSDEKKITVNTAYDISLLTKSEKNIIPNDIVFDKKEPFFYLTGANGGGKTTYLRTVGISVLLFLAGAPIPARSAEIYPIKRFFTHFPRDERFDLAGRFMDENNRVTDITDNLDGNSLVLLNETYSTTAEEMAIKYTEALTERIVSDGDFGVYVTHHHSVDKTRVPFLSVVIDSSDANRRTFKVARRGEAQSSFAYDILKKYNLTEEALEKRFASEYNHTEKGNGESE